MNFKLFPLLVFFWLLFFSCKERTFKKVDHVLTKEDFKKGLELRFNEKNWEKVKSKREEALDKELLVKSKKDLKNAYLIFGDSAIKVKARLKGDHPDHLYGKRWSFRVESKDRALMGMEKISIQGLKTRHGLNEWFFHKMLEHEGMIALEYFIFPFKVNGRNEGHYVFESHFDDLLLSRNNRTQGPILKTTEILFWNKEYRKGEKKRDQNIFMDEEIVELNKKWLKEDSSHTIVSQKAVKLLDAFRKGKLHADSILNIDQWAKYIAMADLYSTYHHLRWHNLRWYYNIESERFEPIGFDLSSRIHHYKSYFHEHWKDYVVRLMLKSKNMKNKVVYYLNKFSSPGYIDQILEKNKLEFEQESKLVEEENDKFLLNLDSLYSNQKKIIEVLKKHGDYNPEL